MEKYLSRTTFPSTYVPGNPYRYYINVSQLGKMAVFMSAKHWVAPIIQRAICQQGAMVTKEAAMRYLGG